MGRCTLRADCSLPKNSSPGERGPLQPSPPLCHSAQLSYGCFSLSAGLEQLKLLLQQGSGAVGRRKATGSGISSLILGKQDGIRKRKWKLCCSHRLPIDLPGERGSANTLQLSGFPVKACSTPGWELLNQGLSLMVRCKWDFKCCTPFTKNNYNSNSHEKMYFPCFRVSLNTMTAKTKDNNSSHFVSDMVN